MFPYNYVDQFTAGIFDFLTLDALRTLVDVLPARASAVWSSAQVMSVMSWAQTVAILVSALFLSVIVAAMIKRRAFVTPGTAPVTGDAVPVAMSTGAWQNRWQEIRSHLDSPREADWKIAVMEADKLVDEGLTRAGFAGDTFGDRLTNIAPGDLLSLDGVWWAHKVRNRLAHEVDYFLRYTEARQAIGYYEQALTELKYL